MGDVGLREDIALDGVALDGGDAGPAGKVTDRFLAVFDDRHPGILAWKGREYCAADAAEADQDDGLGRGNRRRLWFRSGGGSRSGLAIR